MNSRKRRRTLESSSDETQNEDVSCVRQSKRLLRRKQRPKLKLPSRDKVWHSIPSEKSPVKLKHLSPRKTVNNFTKVYNTYNFDDYEDSSSDEEDFLVNDSSENSDDSSSSSKKNISSPRIKNYHRRLKVESSSSDEDSKDQKKSQGDTQNDKDFTPEGLKHKSSRHSDLSDNLENGDSNDNFINSKGLWQGDDKEPDDSSNEAIIFPKHRHNRSISFLDSDDENAHDGENNDEVSTDDENSSSSSFEREESRAEKLRRRSKDLFQQFKELQAQKKSTQSSTTLA